jgi:Phage terminase large subunit (GpA)
MAVPKLNFCEKLVFLNKRQLISFDRRPYLPAIYAANRNLVLRCSRQVEKSTFLANSIIYECCKTPGLHVLVVCPRDEQARQFSHSRLLPAINESPIIRRALLGMSREKPPVTNLEFINGARVYLRAAFNSADACRGISADLLLVDEFQDVAAGHLPVLQETLSHAANGRMILVGTPKSVENHLEEVFCKSTANEWWVRCLPCQKKFILHERCIGQQSVVCPDCSTPVDPQDGRWFPRNPNAAWGEGYSISHLMVPWINHDNILARQQTYDRLQFKNEVLGLPTTIGDSVVTRAELEACCLETPIATSLNDIPRAYHDQLIMGIDWGGGGTSRTVVVVGFMRSDFRFQICCMLCLEREEDPQCVLDQVTLVCQAFQVSSIAADGGGNGMVLNRLLIRRLHNPPMLRFYAVLYSMSNHEPQREGVLWKWTIHRSGSISALFGRIKAQLLYFPRLQECHSFLEEFACEVAEYDDVNRVTKYTHPATKQDDALHATNYALALAVLRHSSSPSY